MRHFSTATTVCAIAAAQWAGTTALAQPAEIANRNVYVIAEELADEVELIRETMGRPYDDSPRLPVAGVSIAEVFFQAQSLLRKSNQLARELAGAELVTAPAAPSRDIRAADIYAIVETALAQIRLVRNELGITEPVVPTEREAEIAPTGLFSTIIDSNRQLDLLIERPITSADVYEEVTFAVIYTAGILAKLAPDVVIEPAPFEGPKLPADVYRRLLECIDIVHRLARSEGVEVLSLSSRRNVPDDIEPGHVYDIANIVVADIAALAKKVGATPVRADLGPNPKHIFPSHVYQRAGTLQRQLETLESR
jgi:hypothetical protein